MNLRQGRIYLLPTKPGLAFAVVLLVMLVTSINYGLGLGYAFTFLLGGAGVASIIHAFRNLLRLSIRYGKTESAFPGGSAIFHFLIDNPDSRWRPALRLIGNKSHGESSEVNFDVPPGVSELSLALPARRRGVLAAGRTVIETRWPLGLIRAWSVFFPDMEALVYPMPEPAPPPPDSGPGANTADWGRLRAGHDDFAGLRDYQITDSPRHLAWKVYAHRGVMMTKQFSASEGGDLLFDWDALPPGLPEEARLSRLSAWLLRAEQAGQRYALRMPAGAFPAERGEAHLHRCLGALALYGVNREIRT